MLVSYNFDWNKQSGGKDSVFHRLFHFSPDVIYLYIFIPLENEQTKNVGHLIYLIWYFLIFLFKISCDGLTQQLSESDNFFYHFLEEK